jgi:predicted nuclease with RNAse H fold
MRTVGVDLSVAEKGTALATIEWEGGSVDRARVGEPSLGLADEALLDLLAEAEWVGIDAPFGWPEAMVGALHSYATTGRWPAPAKPEFRYRRTDLHVHDRVLTETGEKLWPLSPSTDRISLTAWRLAGLREAAFRRSGIRFDRAGGDRVLEVYPAAALLLWGLPREGYKASAEAREELLAALEAEAPWLAWEPGAREACVESDDTLDAVLCALIARATALGLTKPLAAEDRELACVEGWIHLPRMDSLGELLTDGRS